jgi:general secretion pathway protein G
MSVLARRRALRPRRLGFTLVELMVTAAILALLASGAMAFADLAIQRGKEVELRAALRQIRSALDAYKQAADSQQIARAADESGYPHTLDELVAGVPRAGDALGRRIYFLRRLPRDPMASAAMAGLPDAATWGLRAYDSPADDPQPGRDVYDLHSLSGARGLDGRPYRTW